MPGLRTPFSTAHRDSSNATGFVDTLEWQPRRLVDWMSWWPDAVQSSKQPGSTGPAIFTGDFPFPGPKHVSTWLPPVVTIPTRTWCRCPRVRVAANILTQPLTSLTTSPGLVRLQGSSVFTPSVEDRREAHGTAHSWRHPPQIHQHPRRQSRQRRQPEMCL